jgi:hypothetical protein
MSRFAHFCAFLVLSIATMPIAQAQMPSPGHIPETGKPDQKKIQAAADANTSFTPLVLPKDAAEHGISLSGEAKLTRLSNSHYQMGCGCILVHGESEMLVDTCRAKVLIRKGATIVLSAKKDVTRVLNLSDHKRDSVRVMFGKNFVALNPGEELGIVSASASDIDKAATEYVIRFRNAQKLVVSPEYRAVLFDFSLADAMKHCLIFRQLSQSPRLQDKALLADIIKTAAAVNTLFAKSKGDYTHGDNTTIASTGNGKSTAAYATAKRKPPARIAMSNAAND